MKQYVIDAFTDTLFSGNPAAVCILDEWPSDALMQNIAIENNLSETAYVIKKANGYGLRWFTPGGEIDLCGHATLASAYALMNEVEPSLDKVQFDTVSGILTVVRKGGLYEMDFPAYVLKQVNVTADMEEALGAKPIEAYMARDLVCVFEDESIVRELKPDLDKVRALDGLLVHVTAAGKETDCVSRSFGPKLNLPEDPVCGSGHCHLVPYWSKCLGKNDLVAYQASSRGGTLYCRNGDDRVYLAGKAVIYSVAELLLDK